LRRTLLVLALTLATLIVASTTAPSAHAIAFPWTQTNAHQRLRAQRADHLRGQITHWRHLARARASQIGVSLPIEPLDTNALPYLRWLRDAWYQHAQHYAAALAAYQAAPPVATAVAPVTYSGSLIDAFNCISLHEEYGVTGTNTSAGYFGMIYPPSAYPSPGPEYAAQYGDSWLDVPLDAQYQIAIAEQAKYGWSPWSTAGACGL
jgi:hypothetical protein